MNINNLETYIDVVKLGSITKAARKLYLSQPSVSLQIQKIERELGCQLIEREKGKFILTPEGKRFFKYAEYVYQEHQHLLTDIARMHQGITGALSVLSTSIIAEFVLPSILNEFKMKNPSIDINISIDDSFKVIEAIDKREDIIGFCGVLPGVDGIEVIKVGEDRQVLIVYSGHPFTLRNEITISDLIGETFITRAEPVGIKQAYRNSFLKFGLDLEKYQPKLVMGTTTGVLSAVEAKLGIGLISNLAITNSEAMGLVKVIKVKNLKIRRDLYCIYRKENITSSITSEFLEFIRDYSSSYQHQKN